MHATLLCSCSASTKQKFRRISNKSSYQKLCSGGRSTSIVSLLTTRLTAATAAKDFHPAANGLEKLWWHGRMSNHSKRYHASIIDCWTPGGWCRSICRIWNDVSNHTTNRYNIGGLNLQGGLSKIVANKKGTVSLIVVFI